MNKKGKVIIIILVVLVLALGGLSTYLLLNNKDKCQVEKPKQEEKREEKKEEPVKEPEMVETEDAEIKQYNSKSINEQMKELTAFFNSKADADYKKITRAEAQKLVDDKLPADTGNDGCGYDYEFYTYKEYLISIGVGGCIRDLTITTYAYGHPVERIDNAYAIVFPTDSDGDGKSEIIETMPIIKDGKLYYMAGLHENIERPLFLCVYDFDTGYAKPIDVYDLEHSAD